MVGPFYAALHREVMRDRTRYIGASWVDSRDHWGIVTPWKGKGGDEHNKSVVLAKHLSDMGV